VHHSLYVQSQLCCCNFPGNDVTAKCAVMHDDESLPVFLVMAFKVHVQIASAELLTDVIRD
jgi:hypothetical protein